MLQNGRFWAQKSIFQWRETSAQPLRKLLASSRMLWSEAETHLELTEAQALAAAGQVKASVAASMEGVGVGAHRASV